MIGLPPKSGGYVSKTKAETIEITVAFEGLYYVVRAEGRGPSRWHPTLASALFEAEKWIIAYTQNSENIVVLTVQA